MDKKFAGNITDIDKNLLSNTRKINQKGLVKYFSNSLTPVIIAGPTGSGKSSLALKLAKKHRGEIICGDSRQCYQGMQIGTAGPSQEEKAQVPHHGYGILDPKHEKMTAGLFLKITQKYIAEIHKRGHRPFIVGGTGLYLRALVYGLIKLPAKDPSVQEGLCKELEMLGSKKMHDKLALIDAESAKNISPQDSYRIVRALEIFYLTNEKPSKLRSNFFDNKHQKPFHTILLMPKRENLQSMLKVRLEKMFAEGLLEETKRLQKHLPKNHWALETMGFCEAGQLLNGDVDYEKAINLALIRHRQYAKRQETWFKKEKFYTFMG